MAATYYHERRIKHKELSFLKTIFLWKDELFYLYYNIVILLYYMSMNRIVFTGGVPSLNVQLALARGALLQRCAATKCLLFIFTRGSCVNQQEPAWVL